MIAMALICRPALLIADEPTTALDVTVQLQILSLIRRLQKEIGMGVLFITHNLGVVAELADRVAVMYAAASSSRRKRARSSSARATPIRAVSSPACPSSIMKREKEASFRGCGKSPAACQILRSRHRAVHSSRGAPGALKLAGLRCRPCSMLAARIARDASDGVTSMAEPLLEVRDLKVHFAARGKGMDASVKAVDGVSLTVGGGEVVGLVGESGSGKSTLGRAILRLIDPTHGSVRFEGTEVTTLSPKALKAMRSRMQIIFQDPYASLNPRMSVGQIIGEALYLHGIGSRQDRPPAHRRHTGKGGPAPLRRRALPA